MQRGINRVMVLGLLLLLTGCGRPASLRPEAYMQYVQEDKDLVRKVVAGGYEYTVCLATAEYMACKEHNAGDPVAKVAARAKELSGYMYFLIKLGTTVENRKANPQATQDYRVAHADEMVAYYDQQAAMDISLECGGRTLRPVTYLFENNYGLVADNTIVVAFEVGQTPEDLSLTFNDRYTKVPLIKAAFSKQGIRDLPGLNINN